MNCSTDGCDRPVFVKSTGECSTCYSRRYRREHPGKGRTWYEVTCSWCCRQHRAQTKGTQYCSVQCKGNAYRKVCKLPDTHVVMVEIARIKASSRKPKVAPFIPEGRECAWCGAEYVATRRTQAFCSANHKIRAKRVRRRGRQYGSPSQFTWSEFMAVFIRFDRCCAYCEQVIDGQPDPDHVMPLSRGGSNSITNILPSCRLCNSDKRDLSLTEWALDRERRGLPPRVTEWELTDPRTAHLTSLLEAA